MSKSIECEYVEECGDVRMGETNEVVNLSVELGRVNSANFLSETGITEMDK